MSLPPSASSTVIRGRFLDTTGDPLSVTVQFKPEPNRILARTDKVTLYNTAITASSDPGTGDWSIEVLSSDDQDLDPYDWTYTVTITGDVSDTLTGVPAPSDVPIDPGTGKPTVDLTDLVTGSSTGGLGRVYVLAALTDVDLSTPPFGGQQLIYDAERGVWTGGGPAEIPVWDSIVDKPPTFPPSPHSHPTADVVGLDTTLAAKADLASLAAVATSGAFADLTDSPTIPTTPGEVGAAPAVHTHSPADAGAAPVVHSHDEADIEALASKVDKDVQVWNVLDHGVIGDGVAVDTAALQAVLTAAPAGTRVVIPEGVTCKINGTLTISKKLHLSGGEIVQTATNLEAIILTPAASGSSIRNVRMTGPGAVNYGGQCRAIHLAGTNTTTRVTGVLVEDVTASGWSFGVSARLAERFTVKGCTLTDLGYAGVHMFSVNRFKVIDNIIDDVHLTGTNVDCYGITVNRIENVTIAAEPLSEGGLVSRNHVLNVEHEGIDTHGGVNLTISDNYVHGCRTGIACVAGGNENNVETYAPKGIICTGNVVVSGVSDGSREVGIKLVGAGTGAGALVDGATGVISNNYVHGHGLSGATAGGGIMVYYTHGVVISGNTVLEPSNYGVLAYHTNHGLVINGNLVVDPWHPTGGTPAAIYLRDADNTDVLVDGNVGVLGGKSATSKLYRGIWVHSTATGLLGFNHAPQASNAEIVGSVGMKTRFDSYEVQFHSTAATTRKIGFFGETPASRPTSTPANATDLASAQTLVNSLKATLQAYGLIP
ncbi:right-handed parallel beta-helix repeat-containing protein [Actinopolymorpha sp. B17G11]|uniref:right-handed parallel beta-helix repeat-containing protein n=1 Tax=Actinopolymorpha sp. B17G11 TaxID=3160861 RepID=UPI0032E40331